MELSRNSYETTSGQLISLVTKLSSLSCRTVKASRPDCGPVASQGSFRRQQAIRLKKKDSLKRTALVRQLRAAESSASSDSGNYSDDTGAGQQGGGRTQETGTSTTARTTAMLTTATPTTAGPSGTPSISNRQKEINTGTKPTAPPATTPTVATPSCHNRKAAVATSDRHKQSNQRSDILVTGSNSKKVIIKISNRDCPTVDTPVNQSRVTDGTVETRPFSGMRTDENLKITVPVPFRF